MSLTRRRFLEVTAAASALAALGGAPTAFAASPIHWTRAACRYCGTGCGVNVGVQDGKVCAIRGTHENHNAGFMCLKGLTLPQVVNSKQRLVHPLVRRGGRLEEATWDEALALVAARFGDTWRRHGPESVGFYGSGQSSTEETYVANKLFRAGLRTNNVDSNPRLCATSATAGYLSTYGQDSPMGCYEDFDHADVFLVVGSNPAEAHPILFRRMMRRKSHDPSTRIIVLDPRGTPTTRAADLHLSLTPGTDMLVLNAMAHVLVRDGLVDEEFLAQHVVFGEGDAVGRTFADYRASLTNSTPEAAAEAAGCRAEDIVKAARWFGARGRTALTLWCTGVNQRVGGAWTNNLIHNLHLITGKIGRPGSTPFGLTGQPNAAGGIRDGGVMSHQLPYGRLVEDAGHRAEMERLWKVPAGTLSPTPGPAATDLFAALEEGRLKALYVMCTNPGQTLPNVDRYRRAMRREGAFLVVADAFHPTRTTELADVVLPAALWVEKEGVYGCSERRYQLVDQAVQPPGGARPDLDILLDLGRRLGFGDLLPYGSAADVWEEILTICAGTTYDFAGMSRDRLHRTLGLQWPVPTKGHPGTKRRYVKGEDPLVPAEHPGRLQFYARPDGRAVVWIRPHVPPAETVDAAFPFYLTTGRDRDHWHTDTMTRNCAELRQAGRGEARAELHPQDANRIGVHHGDLVALRSRRGEETFRVAIEEDARPGTIFVTMHDPVRMCNRLTSEAMDPVSGQPELKVCAVQASPA